MYTLCKILFVSVLFPFILACGGATISGEVPATTEDGTTALLDEDSSPDTTQVTPAASVAGDEDTGEPESASATAGNTEPEPQQAPEPQPASAAPALQEESESEANEQDNRFTPADITDLILVTGQSNALGSQSAFDVSLDSPHQQVFAFTDQGW